MCEQCNKEKVNHIEAKISLIVAFFYNRILNLTRNSNLDDFFQIRKILISYLLNIYTFLYFNLI